MSPVKTQIDHQATFDDRSCADSQGFVVASELPLTQMEAELARLCETHTELHDESIEKCLFDHLPAGILLSSR